MTSWTTSQGDKETITDQLGDERDPVDLSGRSVQVVVRHVPSGVKVVDGPATIASASQGGVSFTLSSEQTARAGRHDVEWVVTGGSNDPTTYPRAGPSRLYVREDVAQDDLVPESLLEDATVDSLTANSVHTEDLVHDPITKEENILKRQFVTTENLDYHVDPASGDDTNPGTSAEPLATIQEAFDRLPFIIQHDVNIELAAGTYTSEPQTGFHIVNYDKQLNSDEEPFRITGDTANPSNVHLTGDFWFNISIEGRALYRTRIEGVELDGKIQNYGGAISVRNCIINGNSNAGDNVAIDGYGGQTELADATVTATDGVAYANYGHRVYVRNVDAPNLGTAFGENQATGGKVHIDWPTCTISGGTPAPFAIENFDAKPLAQDRSPRHRWQRYSPSWDNGGSAEIDESASALVIPPGDTTVQQVSLDHPVTAGEWECDFSMPNGVGTTGSLQLWFLYAPTGYYTLEFLPNGSANIKRKDDSGNFNTPVSGSWPADSARHSARVTHDGAGGWELFIDGVSQGAGVDTFMPDFSSGMPTCHLRSSTDVETRFHRVKLG